MSSKQRIFDGCLGREQPRVVIRVTTESLRVALATTNLPLQSVPSAITRQSLHEKSTIQQVKADLSAKISAIRGCDMRY